MVHFTIKLLDLQFYRKFRKVDSTILLHCEVWVNQLNLTALKSIFLKIWTYLVQENLAICESFQKI